MVEWPRSEAPPENSAGGVNPMGEGAEAAPSVALWAVVVIDSIASIGRCFAGGKVALVRRVTSRESSRR